eukprot:NODE_6698_length_1647_cov_4.526974.p1 GENE.NODE_6698_length_1647_cov_4.526974~~NODE_6698_length_1647_cov_4.526974.p1  ORF type:complete len:285 (-),score=77.85 NODE_6698_length_1647_cov_4.526974:614-1468(-)
MTSTLLQEYLVELAKKDNLLRLAISHKAAPDAISPDATLDTISRASVEAAAREWPAASDEVLQPHAALLLGASVLEAPTRRLPARIRAPGAALASAPLDAAAAAATSDAAAACVAADTPRPPPGARGKRPPPVLEGDLAAGAPATASCTVKTHTTPPSTPASTPAAALAHNGNAEHYQEFDDSKLSDVLAFMSTHRDDARAQRIGVHAVGRLAHDVAQLRPLCFEAAACVAHAALNSPGHVGVHRLSIAAVSSLARTPEASACLMRASLSFPECARARVGHKRP